MGILLESQTKKKKVLIVSLSNLSRDPRVYRQIEALRGDYLVHAAGKEPSGIEDEFFYLHQNLARSTKLKTLLFAFKGRFLFHKLIAELSNRLNACFRIPFAFQELLLKTNPNTQRFLRATRAISYDLVISNDVSSLVQACLAKGEAKLLYDAHEYSLDEYSDPRWRRLRRPFLEHILKRYLSKADKTLTVSNGIAQKYQADFSIPAPEIIINAPHYHELAPIAAKPEKIRLVHHGVAAKMRMIEEMIHTVDLLDKRFELDFYLMSGNRDYFSNLVKLNAGNRRIRFLDPVSMIQIPAMLNQYDMGLAFFAPLTFNLKHVLPNKFFEFIQARLGVAIGPSPEMAAYVRKYDLGVVSEDFTAESLAKSLNALTNEDIMRFKNNAHKYAYELSAEPQMEKLKSIVESLIGK